MRTILFFFVPFLLCSTMLAQSPAIDTINVDTLKATNTEPLNKNNPTNATKIVPKNKIYVFELNEAIFPAAWRRVKRAVEEAEAANMDYIIVHLNTYGGAVDMADSIRTKLLKAKPTTIAFIDNNAASAGALISLACDSIYMVEGAQIGAATVVNQTGEQMPDKYQSYMRATMRSTAEAQGRDPRIAEAMVDDRITIPGIIDSAKTLTFTTSEALKYGFCEAKFNNIEAVIDHLVPNNQAVVTEYEPTWLDTLIGILSNPMLSGFLMVVMFMGIYAEIQTPGVGFPILAAITASILYFAPNYIEGLAQNWEILLFVIGVILLAVEIFVLPGMGIAGISGIILIFAGLSLSLVQNDYFDFTFTTSDDITNAFTRVLFSIIGSVILAVLLGGKFVKSKAFDRLVLAETQESSKGFTIKANEYEALIGKEGVALTDLKISGKIEVEDERYDAITTGDFIEAGTKVVVKKYQGNYLVVRKV
ncbi:MAG: NfeD family protein [Chitinophagales bacterium]